MIAKEMNKKGDWGSTWTKKLLDELELGKRNSQVGENLVFENRFVKIWTIHLPPQGKLPFHKHDKPYVYIAHNDGISRSYIDNGEVQEVTYQRGDTKYLPSLDKENPLIHNLINIGCTALIFTTIEFKQ
ncbi:cupin domain-containing protein [Galbibacter sp. BG1]|uniref:cupin domain-containing protein n=1 Tax=Galbibacter sp. BG1 TaxID=1170699 RepID=UPI0015BAA6AA|nr:cupin domain-containing protein [Galbibacter sp. BG1]QLE02425.1 cupin domain-containing protein [Galbibacter sp. BG1]